MIPSGGISLSGVPLDGDRIVRLVYCDEAGISNPEQEPYVVVGGVIVDADKKLIAVERHIESLVQRFIPEQFQDDFVFHATELFNGGGPVFKRDDPAWPLKKRLEIAEALAEVPKKFRLPIVYGSVERKSLSTATRPDVSARDKALGAHLVAFTVSTMVVELWMRKHAPGEVCLLVVENNDQARRVLTETQGYFRNGKALLKEFGGPLTADEAKVFPFRKIKHSPLFEPKTPSSVLALADFCAYVFKKHLMQNRHYRGIYETLQGQVVVQSLDEAKKKRSV